MLKLETVQETFYLNSSWSPISEIDEKQGV